MLTLEPLAGERLLTCARDVLEHVPFYRGAKVSRFEELPVLRRDDLTRARPEDWIRADVDLPAQLARGHFRAVTTSGSTDEPLKILMDEEHPFPPDLWTVHGLPADPRWVNLTAPVCLGTRCPGDVAPWGDRGLLLTFRHGLFHAGDAAVRAAVEAFNTFHPDYALVNPVYLHWLAVRAARLDLELVPPRLICVSYQYPSRCQLSALERLFGVPVIGFYGASEFGGTDLALGCPEGHLHLVDYQAFAETVPVPGHEALRELVFSTPLSRTMPLLRYAPGDVGVLKRAARGRCPLWQVPVVEVHGRVSELMNGVTTRAFDEAMSAVKGLLFYQARLGPRGLRVATLAEREVGAGVKAAAARLGFRDCTVTAVEGFELGASGKLQLTGDDETHPIDARW